MHKAADTVMDQEEGEEGQGECRGRGTEDRWETENIGR